MQSKFKFIFKLKNVSMSIFFFQLFDDAINKIFVLIRYSVILYLSMFVSPSDLLSFAFMNVVILVFIFFLNQVLNFFVRRGGGRTNILF